MVLAAFSLAFPPVVTPDFDAVSANRCLSQRLELISIHLFADIEVLLSLIKAKQPQKLAIGWRYESIVSKTRS